MTLDNLISGALGATLAIVATFALDVLGRRRSNLGAARALYFEIASNAAIAREAAEGGPVWRHLSSATWQQVQATMGTFLSPGELKAVAWAYHSTVIADDAMTRLERGGPGIGPDERAGLLKVADAFTTANTLLRARAWGEGSAEA